jgi:iron complex outermembrane receptor protein
VKGTDFGVYYTLDDTPLGDFDLKVNATYLETFFIALSPGAQQIRDAVDSGLISNEITVSQEGDIILQDGQPEWRVSGALTWRHNNGWGAGVRADLHQRVHRHRRRPRSQRRPVLRRGVDPDQRLRPVRFRSGRAVDDVLVRVGSNNIFDEDPPLADETNGYDAAYHSIRGRQVYIDVRKRF